MTQAYEKKQIGQPSHRWNGTDALVFELKVTSENRDGKVIFEQGTTFFQVKYVHPYRCTHSRACAKSLLYNANIKRGETRMNATYCTLPVVRDVFESESLYSHDELPAVLHPAALLRGARDHADGI